MGDLACQATITRRENKKKKTLVWWKERGIEPGDIVYTYAAETYTDNEQNGLCSEYKFPHDPIKHKDKPKVKKFGMALIAENGSPYVMYADYPLRLKAEGLGWKLHKKATGE